MCVGFRAVSYRARDQKLGVSARQLAGGEFPVNGSLNHGPESIFLVHPKCIPDQPKPLCTEAEGEDDLLLATCLTALDGLQDETRRPWVRTRYAVGKDRPPGTHLPTTYGSSGQ